MAKDYNLFVPETKEGLANVGETVINRRQFLRYGFNTAAGVLTASLGVLGFAAILLLLVEVLQVTSQSNSGRRVVKILLGMVQSICNP